MSHQYCCSWHAVPWLYLRPDISRARRCYNGKFFPNTLKGLKAFGTISVLSLAGIWLIKLNFLFFFYRLGNQIRIYRSFWWVVFIFNIGCGASALGLLQYPCMFGELETVFIQCSTNAAMKSTYIRVVMTAVLDVLADVASKKEFSSKRYASSSKICSFVAL